MSQPMGMTDFFAMEANDYLERLDAIVSVPDSPNTREFLRFSRALRGSAIMAGQKPVADVAAGLEGVARGLVETTIVWDEATRQLAIRAVDDLKVLVRAVPQWGLAEDERAQRITDDLGRITGRATVPRKIEETDLDPGTRAFIGREGASVGSTLIQAARSLQVDPRSTEPLNTVLRSMQALRGIACLSDLPPFPDFLDGIERAIQEFTRRPGHHDNAHEFFEAAARAVSRAAQEIASAGRVTSDSTEAERFVTLLGTLFGEEETEDAVPIESLYSGEGSHIVEQGGAPEAGNLNQLEIVSHAEHLRKFATELETAESATQRSIRIHSLSPILRALSSPTMPQGSAEFARAARDAATRGAANTAHREFGRILLQASELLTTAAQSDTDIADDLFALSNELNHIGAVDVEEPTVEMAPPQEPTPAAPPRVDTPSGLEESLAAAFDAPIPEPPSSPLAPDDAELHGLPEIPAPVHVPREKPAFELHTPVPNPTAPTREPLGAQPPAVPVPSISVEPPAAKTPVTPTPSQKMMHLSDGYGAFANLLNRHGDSQGTLEELLAGPPSSAPREPTRPVLQAPEPELPESYQTERVATAPVDAEVMAISDLCYSGDAAFARALSLRSAVLDAIDANAQSDVRELIEEILDLVELGRT